MEEDDNYQKILNLFRYRSIGYVKPHDISSCVNTCATIMKNEKGIDYEEVLEKLHEYIKERNYIGFSPEAWQEINNEHISNADLKNLLLDYWNLEGNTEVGSNMNVFVDQKTTGFRLCSFNVNRWHNPENNMVHPIVESKLNIEKMIEDISKVEADILCLQEAVLNLDIIAFLKDLGYIYNSKYDSIDPDEGESFFTNVIFSKYPIIKKEYKKLDKNEGGTCFVSCDINILNIKLTVINTRLDEFDHTETVRRNQIKDIHLYAKKKYSENNNVIICGDFNSLRKGDYNNSEWKWLSKYNQEGKHKLQTKVTDFMEKNGYEEVFSDGFMKCSTWTARRVDYIWYNLNDFLFDKGNFFLTNSSKHYPIFGDFVVKIRKENY